MDLLGILCYIIVNLNGIYVLIVVRIAVYDDNSDDYDDNNNNATVVVAYDDDNDNNDDYDLPRVSLQLCTMSASIIRHQNACISS